jgi:hypothetical protein
VALAAKGPRPLAIERIVKAMLLLPPESQQGTLQKECQGHYSNYSHANAGR